MSVMFTYDENQAIKAGQSGYINETGAYTGKIVMAKWITTPNGAKGMEIAFETDEGLKSDYLTIYYTTRDGQPITGGHNMIQAIMGCTGVKTLSATPYNDNTVAPELTEKRIGLMIQKVLRLKNDGSETANYQILCPFSPNSRKTLAEHKANQPAERIDYLVAHTKDKDERAKNQAPAFQAQNQFYGQPQQQSAPPQWDGYTPAERPVEVEEVIPF